MGRFFMPGRDGQPDYAMTALYLVVLLGLFAFACDTALFGGPDQMEITDARH